MLSPKEREEIEHDLTHYPNKRAACIEAMKIVQRHRGWVSDEAIRDIAEICEMGAAELEGVATFYNQIYRKPVGKHVVLVCDSVTCHVMGYQPVQEKLLSCVKAKLGQISPDGEFTVIPAQCLGNCDHAPTLMIDDDTHGDVTPDQVEGLLSAYRGQPRRHLVDGGHG
jgi:NADH-quinone oxidoreductase subunit E